MNELQYELYEASVQSPVYHAEWFSTVYKKVVGKQGHHLREDFCGTFRDSIEWVKLHPKNTALGLDLDSEPIQYGEKHHRKDLSLHQNRRLKTLQANVLKPTRKKSDMIIACNFSFYTFKERKTLLTYFKSCKKSLRSKGILFLEMSGGPGMISSSREQKSVTIRDSYKFKYTWHQKSFDPISHNARYSIHFKLPDSQVIKDAFTYDWRLWTIPEVKDALLEAGYKKVDVFWETGFKGKGTGEYVISEKGDNAYSWIAYVVGSL